MIRKKDEYADAGTGDDTTARRLLGAFMRFSRQQWRRHVALGLRPHDYFLLHWAQKYQGMEGKGPRAAELGARMGIAPPTLTQHVARLERMGLLERRMDPEDRRSVRIRMLPEGERRLQAGGSSLLRSFDELARYLGPERTEAFISALSDAAEFFERRPLDDQGEKTE